MTTQNKKTFDCVEMKNRIQAEVLADYESRRGEFPSFVDFVKNAAAQSDYVRAMHERFGKPKTSTAAISVHY